MSAEPRAWPYCYQCDGPPTSKCTRCGRFFCPEHGGQRLCWRPIVGPGLGGKFALYRRALCDQCTPNPVWMAVSIALLIGLAVTSGLLALWLVSGMRR